MCVQSPLYKHIFYNKKLYAFGSNTRGGNISVCQYHYWSKKLLTFPKRPMYLHTVQTLNTSVHTHWPVLYRTKQQCMGVLICIVQNWTTLCGGTDLPCTELNKIFRGNWSTLYSTGQHCTGTKCVRLHVKHVFIYLCLLNFIKPQLCLSLISVRLNFLISVNCATRRKYIFGHAHVCRIPFEIPLLIRGVFHMKRNIDIHIEIYPNSAVRPWTCGLINTPARYCLHFTENGEVKIFIIKVFRFQQKTLYWFCCLFLLLLRSSVSNGRPYCYSSVSFSLLLLLFFILLDFS